MSTTDGFWHKLTRDQALQLRENYRQGHSMARLTWDFKVSRTTVSEIVRGRVRPVLGLPNISRGPGRPRKRNGIDTLPS